MKKNFFLISAFLLYFNYASGQNDPQAVKILDEFSSKALAAPSVSMKFLLQTDDQLENSTDTLSGHVIISKDKYKLDLPDNIVWFNGQSSWSYLPVEKEVTITSPDKKDDSFQNRPSAVFTIYKKGYKSRLIEEKADAYVIDLYPEDLKTDILRIRLTIGKSLGDLKTLEYKNKEGSVYTLHIKEYSLKFKPDNQTFVFQADKYKGVEVIDMR
jgi:outer membrane lipoprotein-sorting protein